MDNNDQLISENTNGSDAVMIVPPSIPLESAIIIAPNDPRLRDRTVHKVMLSSTTLDLPLHRREVADAIWRAGMLPVAMERDTAADTSPYQYSMSLVDEADVYVGIFGYRYGHVPHVPENPNRLSMTELEYRRAVELNIPCLIYLMHEDHLVTFPMSRLHELIETDPEKRQKLQQLMEEVRTELRIGYFKSHHDLGRQVIQGLNGRDLQAQLRSLSQSKRDTESAQRQNVAVGSSFPSPPLPYIPHRYILTRRFVGRAGELDMLSEWADSQDTMLVIRALGGVGKSALAWLWFKRHAFKAIPGLAGAVWWSFYESQSSFTSFVTNSLAYVTNQPQSAFNLFSYTEQENLLFEELSRKRYLIVLDGLERLLETYHRMDAAQLPDHLADFPKSTNDQSTHWRSFTDSRRGEFLKRMVGCVDSKILITTRLLPTDFEDPDIHTLIPGIRLMELEGLDRQDTLALLRAYEIEGDQKAILDFLEKFHFHPLFIGVVVGLIRSFRNAPGNFDAWYREEGHLIRLSKLRLRKRRTHILEASLNKLGTDSKVLLEQLAAFRYPVSHDTLATLNPFLPPRPFPVVKPQDTPAFTQYQDLKKISERAPEISPIIQVTLAQLEASLQQDQARFNAYITSLEKYQEEYKALESEGLARLHAGLRELEDSGLIQWDREARCYDLHPIIRSHASELMPEDEKKRTFLRINDYLQNLPSPDPSLVMDINDLWRDLEIFNCLMGVELYDQAAEFFEDRLQWVLMHKVGAYNTIIELLQSFFEKGLEQPRSLSQPNFQDEIMGYLATVLRLVGRLSESEKLRLLQIRFNVTRKHAVALCLSLTNYGVMLRSQDRLAEMMAVNALARDLAETIGDNDEANFSYLCETGIAVDTGQWERAEIAFKEFKRTLGPMMTSGRKDIFAWGLFYRSKMQVIRGRGGIRGITQALEIAQTSSDVQLKHLALRVMGDLHLQKRNYSLATQYYADAIELATKISAFETPIYLSRLALAEALEGDKPSAKKHIESALSAENNVSEIDNVFINAAEVYAAVGDGQKAGEYALLAYKRAWADGPPFAWWWALKRSKKLLADLHISKPKLSRNIRKNPTFIDVERDVNILIDELRARQSASNPLAKLAPNGSTDVVSDTPF